LNAAVARMMLLAVGLFVPHPPKAPPPKHPAAPKAPPPKPAKPLAMLPSVGRVTLELRGDQIVVTEDIALPRGDYKSGDLELYVAFGAPGVPQAVDAHLLPVEDGELGADPSGAGDRLTVDFVPHAPVSANALVGSASMAGFVVHLREATFVKALAPGNMAMLRIRSLLAMPALDHAGSRSVIVRLGAPTKEPMPIGRIEIDPKKSSLEAATAQLCGPDAESYPLTVWKLGATPVRMESKEPRAPIAPVLAVRHATDSLCLTFKSKP
jgi:hypothetical protein